MQEVLARLEDYTAAYQTGDVNNVVALYTTDCYYVAPGQGFIRGREGIVRAGIVKQMMDLGGKTIKFKVANTLVTTDAVCVVATFSLYNSDGEEIDDGRILNVWVKRDGVWLIKYDMFN